MSDPSYFVFGLSGVRYAIPTEAMREILLLPELTPMTEAPDHIVGLFNLRGRVVPVMDLERRFGYMPHRYCLADHVVILQWEGVLLGLIVEAVYDVLPISPDHIEKAPRYGIEGKAAGRFISGVAKIDQGLLGILNLSSAIGQPETLEPLDVDAKDIEMKSADFVFCPDATKSERQIFRERADQLMHERTSQNEAAQKGLIIIRVGREKLGLDLAGVREISEVASVTPVPCCPGHIVGLINFRGEVVTLLDFASLLNLPPGSEKNKKAVVIQTAGWLVGLLVDDVQDVIYVSEGALDRVPSSIEEHRCEYLRGTITYQGKMLGVVDLPQMLTEEAWNVQDEV